MCKFCKLDKFGIDDEIAQNLKSKTVGVGNFRDAMSLEAWILARDDIKPKITLTLTTKEGFDIARMDIPIAYCPKCGRKLIE